MLNAQLGNLEAAGLVRLAQDQPELEYLFRHALIQEAAYASLLKQDRRALHKAVGEVLEQVFAGRLDEQLGLLAYHYSQAELWDKTFQYALAAANRAKRLYAMAEALGYYDLAISALDQLDPHSENKGADRFDILSERHGVSSLLGQFERSLADLQEMVGLARRLGDDARLSDALTGLGDIYFTLGPLSAAQTALEEALTVKRRLGDPRRLADSLNNLAGLCFGLGRSVEGLAAYHEAHDLYTAVGDPDGLARNEWMVGACHYNFLSDYGRAFQHLTQALHYTRQSGNRALEAGSLLLLGANHVVSGDFEAGYAHLEQALKLSEELGDRRGVGWAWLYQSWADRERGEFGLSEARVGQALEVGRAVGEKYLTWYSYWALARLGLLQAKPALAHEQAQQMGRIIQDGISWPQTSIWSKVMLAVTAAAAGLTEGVQGWIEEALGELAALEDQGMCEVQGVYYNCHLALQQAGGHSRNNLLQLAYTALQARAASLDTEEQRRLLLTQIAVNRAILADWERNRS